LREQYAMGVTARWDALNFDGARAAEQLPAAIGDAVLNQGRPGFGYAGSKRLVNFAIDQLGIGGMFSDFLTPVVYGLGPIGFTEFIEDHMPSGLDLASGAWSQNMENVGTRMRSGVYLSPAGKLRGSRIRSMIVGWLAYEAEHVWPVSFPFPRTKLIEIYGTWVGSSRWGTFAVGDTPKAGSKIANAQILIDSITSAIEDADSLCSSRWAVETSTMAQMSQAEIDRINAEIAEKKAADLRKNLFVFAALGGAAWLAVR